MVYPVGFSFTSFRLPITYTQDLVISNVSFAVQISFGHDFLDIATCPPPSLLAPSAPILLSHHELQFTALLLILNLMPVVFSPSFKILS